MGINLEGEGMTLAQAIATVQSEDSSGRYYAAWYLGHLQDPQAIAVLTWALQDERERTALGGYPLRRKAAESLGRIGDQQAVQPLIAALDCPDLHVRESVAWALGQLGDLSAVPVLLELLANPTADEPFEVVIEAVGYLAFPQGLTLPEAQPLIHRYLEHSSERVRCAAYRTLYVLTGKPDYAEYLITRLQDPDIHIRRAALFDLADIAYLPAVAAIAQCEVTTNLKVHALKRMIDLKPEASPETLEPVMSTLSNLL